MSDWVVAIIPLLPLCAGVVLGVRLLTRPRLGEDAEWLTARAASSAVLLAAAALVAVIADRWLNGLPDHVVLGSWLESGRVHIAVSFQRDTLSLCYSTLIAVLGWGALRFSERYLHREPGFHRFFVIVSLFIGAMFLVALAGNPALLFFGWEIAGVCSYLLIAYAHDRPNASAAATYAVITNRIGDAAFVLGLSLSLAGAGNLEWPALLHGTTHADPLFSSVVGFCFVLAGLAKSAQLPFTVWITKALEGPTPSSALFYGALLVHAGIYLILRIQPLISASAPLSALLAVVGGSTALYGAFCGLTRSDVKSALIFSTIAQLGLMVLACGLGWWTLATVHLFCHAIVRTHQFMTAPSFLHLTRGQPMRPVPRWLRRQSRLYTASVQRLWLETLLARWFVRPVHRLATDLALLESNAIDKVIGLPGPTLSMLSSLAAWEERRLAASTGVGPDTRRVGGLLGYCAHHVASALHWFEEKLVLQGFGRDLWQAGRHLGNSLSAIEHLLQQPRYLMLIVFITLLCTP